MSNLSKVTKGNYIPEKGNDNLIVRAKHFNPVVDAVIALETAEASEVDVPSPGTSGNFLISNGTAWTSAANPNATIISALTQNSTTQYLAVTGATQGTAAKQ